MAKENPITRDVSSLINTELLNPSFKDLDDEARFKLRKLAGAIYAQGFNDGEFHTMLSHSTDAHLNNNAKNKEE